MQKYDIAIIGGGILGTTISYWLSILYDLKLCVIEKERDVAMHTSSRNTGVVHSPFYMNPKKREILSKSALLSRDLWKILAKKKKVPWMEVGTIEVALDEQQHKTLEKYTKWAEENGIPEDEIELLYEKEISKLEPNLNCYSGLFCKRDVSTDYGIFTKEIKKESEKNGTKFLFLNNVQSVEKNSKKTKLYFSDDSAVEANFVINCSGGNSLDIAQKFGLAKEYNDLHFRGEYWIADSPYADLVKTNIYTVARFPEYPFLDPHWIKRSNGQTEIGPNAVPVSTPETYEGYVSDLPQTISKIREIFGGNVRKLLLNSDFLSLISKEFLSSVSKTAMVHRVQQFIPSVEPEYFTKHGTSGIRTPIITPKGTFLPDVLELYDVSSFHIINYNSPGATGAPAYSAYVIKSLQEKGFLDYPQNPKDSIWDYEKLIDQY